MTASLPRRRSRSASLARLGVRLLVDVPKMTVPEAARVVGVSRDTIHKYWRLAYPGTTPGRLRNIHNQRSGTIEPFAELCDTMVDSLTGTMSAGEWFEATRKEYGTVGERRLYRGVRRLVETGRVRRIERPQASSLYERIP